METIKNYRCSNAISCNIDDRPFFKCRLDHTECPLDVYEMEKLCKLYDKGEQIYDKNNPFPPGTFPMAEILYRRRKLKLKKLKLSNRKKLSWISLVVGVRH